MTTVETNLADWPAMSDHASSDMPTVGRSPWGGDWPSGVWCWDEVADQVLIGTCPGDAEILTYAEARERRNESLESLRALRELTDRHKTPKP